MPKKIKRRERRRWPSGKSPNNQHSNGLGLQFALLPGGPDEFVAAADRLGPAAVPGRVVCVEWLGWDSSRLGTYRKPEDGNSNDQ